jgi:hypothetical protein
MRRFVLIPVLCLIQASAFAQRSIDVPNFADASVKTFYQTYSAHLLKCIAAIREKNEAKAIALFKDPGEQLVAREKIIAKNLATKPAEKQKYLQYAIQVYPYLMEVEASEYYRKIYGH